MWLFEAQNYTKSRSNLGKISEEKIDHKVWEYSNFRFKKKYVCSKSVGDEQTVYGKNVIYKKERGQTKEECFKN